MVGRPFQPGQSGNPGGRPKEKAFRMALKSEIERQPEALVEIARKLISKARKGDLRSIREFADRIDGRVPQAVVGDDEHDPIRIEATDEQREEAIAALLAKNALQGSTSE